MGKELQEKLIKVSKKYVDLLEKQIDKTLEGSDLSTNDFEIINDGIRTIHHVIGAISKLDACSKRPETSNKEN